MLHQLNVWYSQQSALVNNWYSRISLNCSSQAPGRDLRGSDIGDLDPDEIEDLEVDDEDRTVRIRIPNNPRGFEPR